MGEKLVYEEVVITDKNRSRIVVTFANGRIEKRAFMSSKQEKLIEALEEGEKVIAVLNEMAHDEVPGVGIKEHLNAILVPGDSNYQEASLKVEHNEARHGVDTFNETS